MARDAALLGSSYTLTCNVTVTPPFTLNITTWRQNGVILSGETERELSFTSLTLSNAGVYTCDVTVTSMLLRGDIMVTSDTYTIILPSKKIILVVKIHIEN